ncbi:MAG: hypothetical protein NTX40_07815 [Planctomycetota bacterium]|nr:hypothetical protein [Planctomycetota bacterium]
MKPARMLLIIGIVGVLLSAEAISIAAEAELPTADQLLSEAARLYDGHKYDAALKRLNEIQRDTLGFWDKGKFDSLLSKTQKAVGAKAADEQALAEGQKALDTKRVATAVESLSQAANSAYLEDDKRDQAKGLLQVAEERHRQAEAKAKELLGQAKQALDKGQTAEARAAIVGIRAMDVKLGIFDRMALGSLEKKLAGQPAATPPQEKVVVASAEPVDVKAVAAPSEPAKAKVAPPAEPAKAKVAAPAEPVEAAPAAAIRETAEKLTLADQARRAEAENETQLGEMALKDREYEKAKIHFTRALALWPESERAAKGRDEVMRLLGEREEPVIRHVEISRDIERQRVTANVLELVSESERLQTKAERPEDYDEARRPLDEADRLIDLARVLMPEEAEGLREQVLVLRGQINKQRAEAEAARKGRAEIASRKAEGERIAQYEQDQQQKIQQLWDRAKELRRSMQFPEAIEVLDRLIAIDPQNDRARLWRDDMMYTESQVRQTWVRKDRQVGRVEAFVDTEQAAIHPGEMTDYIPKEKPNYLRYPDAKMWQDLTVFRRKLTQMVSEEPPAVSQTRARLAETIDLDFEHTSLDNVLKYISEVKRGLNIVPDPDLATGGIDLTTRVVDLKVKGVSIESVLSLILGADLGYKVEAGYILVTTRAKLQQNLPIVTYPVQDLVASIPDFGGLAPRFEIGDVTGAAGAASGSGGGGFGELFGGGAAATAETEQIGWKELVDIIKRNVNTLADPSVAAWTDEGGPSAIDYMNGLLIVTQTRQGHTRVSDLLEKLRRERAIMISVEARFVTVADDFLQDITLDVDVQFDPAANPLRWNPAGQVVQDPAAGAFDTLPGQVGGVAGTPRWGSPIIVSGTGSNGLGTSTLLPLAGTAFATFTANEGGMAVSGVFLDDLQIGFLLRAIQADSRSTTLFSPRITLYNGQRSYISISNVITYLADAEPIVAEAAVAWDPVVGSIPVGATLDVKATVSADRRYVQLDLRPQVADTNVANWRQVPIEAIVPGALPAVFLIDLPQVSLSDLRTTVSVPDGGTLLLGGNKRYGETEVETGVPILNKIPILRRLFNNRASLRTNSNLLILIRPKILIQSEEEHKLGYDDF